MQWIVGIDEVGRGALAGPVVVVAAAVPCRAKFRSGLLGRLKDSKKLAPKKREAWAKYLKERPGISFAVARVYPRQIEKRNISNAANLAAKRAFERLRTGLGGAESGAQKIFLDGGLYLGKKDGPIKATTLVKGDEKINAVKIASIFAKVYRDRLMCRLAKTYSAYGFEIHKGYATRMHRVAVRKHGPSPVHRLTFVGKSAIMNI